MAVIKRVTAQVGESHRTGSKTAAPSGLICPHCHRQTQLVPMEGQMVCQLCGKAPGDRP